MEIDGEDNNEDDHDVDNGGDTEEDEPAQMSVDEEGDESTPKKSKAQRNKLQPRKSQLDINALQQEQVAVANLDEKAISQLKMQKKFCSDALIFINEIENAMEPMIKLLGSKNKAEVQEVMDFLKAAHEYSFESAKVRSSHISSISL